MTSPVRVSSDVINETLKVLLIAGREHREGIVLWLGEETDNCTRIRETYVPVHRSGPDFFHIPPRGMDELLAHLDNTGTRVVAQVHSHPYEAFHSAADDAWAIVSHRGALSLVVPYFALGTDSNSFLERSAVFQLSARGRWELITGAALDLALEVSNAS